MPCLATGTPVPTATRVTTWTAVSLQPDTEELTLFCVVSQICRSWMMYTVSGACGGLCDDESYIVGL